MERRRREREEEEEKINMSYVCDTCGKQFSTSFNMQRHPQVSQT